MDATSSDRGRKNGVPSDDQALFTIKFLLAMTYPTHFYKMVLDDLLVMLACWNSYAVTLGLNYQIACNRQRCDGVASDSFIISSRLFCLTLVILSGRNHLPVDSTKVIMNCLIEYSYSQWHWTSPQVFIVFSLNWCWVTLLIELRN